MNYRIRDMEWTLLFNSIYTFIDEETGTPRDDRA